MYEPSSASNAATDAKNAWLTTSENTSLSKSAAPPPPLPLQWTQLGDRTRSQDDDPSSASLWKCCGRRGCRHARQKATSSIDPQKLRRRHSGRVIFCLLETDPSWFQGYFFPSSSSQQDNSNNNKAWRLLATRRQLDECVGCVEGGFRMVDLSVTTTFNNKSKETFSQVAWTGADMMILASPHVQMRTEKLATGVAAASMAERVFAGLLRQVRQHHDNDGDNNQNTDEPALDLFPDLAIVAGTMDISLAIDPQEKDLYELMFND